MRFKFRVWDKGTELWAEPNIFNPLLFVEDGSSICIEGKHPDHVVQQFTGQVDKNGVEIYEGDLISFNDNPCKPFVIFEVKYFPCWGAYYLTNDVYRKSLSDARIEGEVVGNIYEKENIE